MSKVTTFLVLALLVAVPAQADLVTVTVLGQVVGNQIGDPPLSGVGFGEGVTMTFTVDSNVFLELLPGDVRGYEIDPSSFLLSFSGGVTQGLLMPPPATPYFSLVDGFPLSDGFFVATSAVSPGGVPLEQEPFNANLDLGYDGATLSSLNILDALGVYDFTGLTRFGFNLWAIFPDNVAMEMDFMQMTIESGPVSVDGSSWGGVKALYR